MATKLAIQTAADAFGNRDVDTELLLEFANILDDVWSKPWLGNASTMELLSELMARTDIMGYADYKAESQGIGIER